MSKISASILGCRHTAIGEDVYRAAAAGAGYIHIDIMDGDYVDNITFGPQLVDELREITMLPLSVHLETKHPSRMFRLFENTAANIVTFQFDVCENPICLINKIHASGKKAAVGIGPAYGVEALQYILPYVDYINVMSVEPGFGGQRLESSVYSKLVKLKSMVEASKLDIKLAVDGGINEENAVSLLSAGADILICGSSVFKEGRIEENMQRLLKATEAGNLST